MTTKIAINGFGRIGRCVLRALIEEVQQARDAVAEGAPAESRWQD